MNCFSIGCLCIGVFCIGIRVGYDLAKDKLDNGIRVFKP